GRCEILRSAALVIACGRHLAVLDAHPLLLRLTMFVPSVFQVLSGCVSSCSSRTRERIAYRTDSGVRMRMPECEAAIFSGAVIISRTVLLDAVSKGKIQAWLQPKVAVASGQLVAVEALARWRHPQWGLLSPDVFLPWFRAHGLDEALLMHI